MARFDAGMEAMAETYIFETDSLLSRLDEILLETEKEQDMQSDRVNEIFRIMHTIKGSSAMMGLENISSLAHSAEDMFSLIREGNAVITDMQRLYDLMFELSDLLRAELEALQDDSSEPADFGSLLARIKEYTASLSGKKSAPDKPAAQRPAQSNVITVSERALADTSAVRVRFEADCGMTELRAILVLNSIKGECAVTATLPTDPENDPSAGEYIAENGFIIEFTAKSRPVGEIASLISDMPNVSSCELTDPHDRLVTVPIKSLTEVKVGFEEGCGMENLRAMMVIRNIRDRCERLAFLPEDIETNEDSADTIRQNGFTVYFNADCPDDELLSLITDSPCVSGAEIIKHDSPNIKAPAAADADKKASENTQAADTAPAPDKKPQAKADKPGAAKKNEIISVSLSKLDRLLDLVGEIVITEAMVTSAPDLNGLRLDNFNKAARQLKKLHSQLRDIAMSVRMVPISGVFGKMTRIVRDMKQKLSKDVELIIEGGDTEVDKAIVDSLNDPLMHMVRNSMDHGIEKTAAERIAAGKPAAGTITLSARSLSGEVIVTVSDDGAGMDPQKLLDKAQAKGLLTKPRSEYTDKEAFGLIMLPGFSTNEAVTEYSGRGVGMDVVKKSIEKCGGSLSVESAAGRGTSFIIRIPLSLSIVTGMKVAVGGSVFTVPISYMREAFKLRPEQLVYDTDGNEMILIRGECYPLLRLYSFYEISGAVSDIFGGIILLAQAGERRICLLADELIGEQQVVVKPFAPLINRYGAKQKGMAGCSILSDGSITVILDIDGIASEIYG